MRRSLVALALLCAFGPLRLSFAECLEVVKPNSVVLGGVYSCIVIGREATGSTLEEVVVDGSPGNGIEIYADQVTLKDVTVRNSHIVGALVGCAWEKGECLYVPRGISFIGGSYMNNGNNGIKWDACDGCTIRNARMAYNANSGIQINFVRGRYTVADCEIDHNGLTILPGQKYHAHGIYTTEPGLFHHNHVHHNGGYGIHIWPGPSERATPEAPLDIRYNRIDHNGDGGTVLGGGQARGTVIYWHNTEYENGDDDLMAK